MEFNAFPQQSGHLPEKSTTMWTTPQSDEEKRYFSKHAPKRRIYGMIQIVLQGLHGFLAFAAWYSIFTWAFSGIDALQPFAGYLAATLLIVFHLLFRTTWDTYWYDRLDDDPKTDSSIWIPCLILVVLLVTEATGARIFLEGQVKPAAIKTTEQVDQQRTAEATGAKSEYDAQVSNIELVYKEKQRAAALPFNGRITQLRKRRIDSQDEKKYIYNQIAAQERLRDEAAAPIAAAKAAELETALKNYQVTTTTLRNRHQTLVQQVDTHNTGEQTRVEQGLQNAKANSWLISAVLILLIAALGYARVRINVKSGILPKRNFTVLDAHGSMIERILTAFGDASNRRTLQLAVWFHRTLSPKQAITSFDGTIVAQPGTYNTPTGVFTPQNTPAPSTPNEQIGLAYQKVWAKINGLQQNHPGYMPAKPVIEKELQKALSMNGSYTSAPWDDDLPGKQ